MPASAKRTRRPAKPTIAAPSAPTPGAKASASIRFLNTGERTAKGKGDASFELDPSFGDVKSFSRDGKESSNLFVPLLLPDGTEIRTTLRRNGYSPATDVSHLGGYIVRLTVEPFGPVAGGKGAAKGESTLSVAERINVLKAAKDVPALSALYASLGFDNAAALAASACA